MSLSEEDRRQLGDILRPLANATKDQAKTLKGQAETMGKLGERMSHVETNIEGIKESVDHQREHCETITSDFAKEFRSNAAEIASVKADTGVAKIVAEDAKQEAVGIRKWLWGLLAGIFLLGLKYIISGLAYVFNGGK